MGFRVDDLGPAATVFLSLFVFYNFVSHYIVYKQRKFKLAYTLLCFYGLLRLGGQTSGVGYAIMGYIYYKWLIAYIVLTLEGYFMLVLTSFYMAVREDSIHHGSSVMEQGVFKKNGERVAPTFKNPSPKHILHYLLIGANALLVAGCAMLAGLTDEELASESSTVVTSEVIRTIGQATFLVTTVLITCFTVYLFHVKKVVTKTMYCLLAAAPFLWVRGIFGILAVYIDDMNYLVTANYANANLHQKLTIYEYVLSTTMEFIAAVILIGTYWIRTPDPEEVGFGCVVSNESEKRPVV